MVSTLKWAKCHSACSCSSPLPTKSDQVQVKELGGEVQGKRKFSDLLFLSCFQTTRPLHCRLLQRCPLESQFLSFPRSPVWWPRYLVIIVQDVDQLSNRSDRRKGCKRRKLTKTFAVSRSLCFPRRRAHLLVLHRLPARLGRVDLDGGGRAVDGLHMSESWVLNGEEEGGALQGGGDWTTRITLFRQCKNSMYYMVLINKRQTREESATQSDGVMDS